MVCPVCGEALELEGYEVGDLVDCEACGAVLRLLSDGGLEVVVPPGGEKEPLWGLEAYGDGEEAVLRFSDGTLEEEVRVAKAGLAEALRRLEEGVGRSQRSSTRSRSPGSEKVTAPAVNPLPAVSTSTATLPRPASASA